MHSPGTITKLDYRWIDDSWRSDPLGWSRRRQTGGTTGQRSGDTRTDRDDQPQYQSADDAEAAAGVDWDDQCLVCIGPQFTTD